MLACGHNPRSPRRGSGNRESALKIARCGSCRLFAGLALVALVLSLPACGPGGPLAVRLRADVVRPPRSVVLFICDGMSRDLVTRGCAEGRLPNIRKRLVEGGVRVEHAVCELPSITYPNLMTFATGVGPPRHGITGNAWFDRYERLYRYYLFIKHYRTVNEDSGLPTLFELARPGVSANVQSAFKRGVTENFANWAVSGVMWFFGDYTAVDKLTATTLDAVAGWANRQRRWPELTVLYFPGVDSVGHRFGPASPRYRWSIEHFDHQLGRVCDWLEREKLLDSTYLVLVSDHGQVETQTGGRIDLLRYANGAWGRRATDEVMQDPPRAARDKHFAAFDTVIVDKGVRYAAIHLASPRGWDELPAFAEVAAVLDAAPAGQRLWELPGVEHVAYRESETRIQIRSAAASAQIEERPGPAGPEFRYTPLVGDPLALTGDAAASAAVAAGFHDAREWLHACRDAQYPSAVAMLPALLRSPRAGQVAVLAAPGYSFADERGGHGGIRRDEVIIPLMFAGPGLPAGGVVPIARGADLVPTILTLLGRAPLAGDAFDGVALFAPPAAAR